MRGTAGRVDAVCLPRELVPAIAYGFLSGIAKLPVAHPVAVRRLGISGDHQGDVDHHGGLFKAVYAYAREAREELALAEGRELPDGFFGENLVTVGQDTDGAIIGERWRIGTAVLEATCVRDPCTTFAERMEDPRWPRRFRENGRCGAYFRVVKEGELRAGDAIEVIARPDHGVSIQQAFRGLDAEAARRLLEFSRETGTVLYASLVRAAETAIRRAGGQVEHPAHLSSTGR